MLCKINRGRCFMHLPHKLYFSCLFQRSFKSSTMKAAKIENKLFKQYKENIPCWLKNYKEGMDVAF